MSFILDALKKLEQEKAARRNASVNISDEILAPRRPVSRSRRSGSAAVVWGVAAVLVLVILAAVGGMLFTRATAVREAKVVPPESELRPREETLRPPVDRSSYTLPPVAVSSPNPDAEREPADSEVPGPLPLSGGPDDAPVAGIRVNPAPSTTTPRMSNGSVESKHGGEVVHSSGNLKVSGIAWQETRSARRAVVNGVLLGEGATVEGAQIEEIFPARVRFSSGGRSFDVSVSGPLQAR